jgi:fluoride ion exporter CrcB/FEX
MRYARALTFILLGLLGTGFLVGLTTVPTFRAAISLLVRETLQFEGARLFVWAVLFTIIFGVGCLARPGSRSA